MAQAPASAPEAGWRFWASWICAILSAVIFLVSGLWKLTDPLATEQRMVQMLFPAQVALVVAIGTGLMEAWAGLLILVPRWRRWGAALCSLLLVAFMVYMAVNYTRLTGEDCSCFPWLKRVVGPGFFIGDGVMLLWALGAGVWARPAESFKRAALALGALVVFAGVVLGVNLSHQTGLQAPAVVQVNGRNYDLHSGRILVYFFDPECMHCFAGAKAMSGYKFRDVKVVAVPTRMPQWSAGFLRDTGLKADVTNDVEALRKVFQFTDPPYGVALERGRQVKALSVFDEKEPLGALRGLGWVE